MCDHIIGFEEGDDYGHYSGGLCTLSTLNLEEFDNIKKDGVLFKFCPKCSHEVTQDIEDKIESIRIAIEEADQREAKKRQQRKEHIQNQINMALEKLTELSLVDYSQYYHFYFKDKRSSIPTIYTGDKKHIVRNLVFNNLVVDGVLKSNLSIEKIVPCMTRKEVFSYIKKHLNVTKEEKEIIRFTKGDYFYNINVDEKGGLLYMDYRHKDNEKYDRGTASAIFKFLNVPVEEMNLIKKNK